MSHKLNLNGNSTPKIKTQDVAVQRTIKKQSLTQSTDQDTTVQKTTKKRSLAQSRSQNPKVQKTAKQKSLAQYRSEFVSVESELFRRRRRLHLLKQRTISPFTVSPSLLSEHDQLLEQISILAQRYVHLFSCIQHLKLLEAHRSENELGRMEPFQQESRES